MQWSAFLPWQSLLVPFSPSLARITAGTFIKSLVATQALKMTWPPLPPSPPSGPANSLLHRRRKEMQPSPPRPPVARSDFKSTKFWTCLHNVGVLSMGAYRRFGGFWFFAAEGLRHFLLRVFT